MFVKERGGRTFTAPHPGILFSHVACGCCLVRLAPRSHVTSTAVLDEMRGTLPQMQRILPNFNLTQFRSNLAIEVSS